MTMDNYTAISIAEGFCEGEPTQKEQLEAWSYIGKHGLHKSLQGFFGRTLQGLIDNGILDNEFNITEFAISEHF